MPNGDTPERKVFACKGKIAKQGSMFQRRKALLRDKSCIKRDGGYYSRAAVLKTPSLCGCMLWACVAQRWEYLGLQLRQSVPLNCFQTSFDPCHRSSSSGFQPSDLQACCLADVCKVHLLVGALHKQPKFIRSQDHPTRLDFIGMKNSISQCSGRRSAPDWPGFAPIVPDWIAVLVLAITGSIWPTMWFS